MKEKNTTEIRERKILSASLYEKPDSEGKLSGYGQVGLVAAPATVKFEEDDRYIYPRFRAISKIIIPGYNLNFTLGDVLKKSTPLIEGQTVYPDHNTSVEKWLGVVMASQWTEGMPPGIDILLRIDKLHNPKIADGLKSNPPAIHSGSIGVRFNWAKSHPDLETFWEMLGEEVNGRIVSIDVTEITRYDEFSLVYQGGDPNAKHRGFGGLSEHNPSIKIMHSFSTGDIPQKSTKEEKMKLSQSQAESLGLTATGEKELSQTEFDSLVKSLSEERQKLQKDNESLKSKAAFGERSEKALRDETEKNFRLIAGEKPDEQILKLIATGEIDMVVSLGIHYRDMAEQMHPLRENNDGEQTRRSSVSNNPDQIIEKQRDVSVYKEE